MKKFLLHSFLFTAIIFVLVFLLDMISVSDDYVIHKTEKTSYEKIAWNLNLINKHPEKITGSSIFMGSSLMRGDISDSILRSNNIPAINMGVNGTGHEVILFFLEKIIPFKPGKIYLHLYKIDKSALHDMTPLLFTPKSLLEKGQSFSLYFIKFLFKRIYFVADYALWKLKGSSSDTASYKDYGCVYRVDSFEKEKYKEIKKETTDDYFYSFNLHRNDFVKENEKRRTGFYFKILPVIRKIRYNFLNSEFFFNCKSQSKFAINCLDLCRKNNIETKRIYLPMVCDAKINKEFDETFYVPRGGYDEIISLNNFSFLDSAKYWADLAHMSREGSMIFTKKLLEEKVVE